MSPKKIRHPPDHYTGTLMEWKALSGPQQRYIVHALELSAKNKLLRKQNREKRDTLAPACRKLTKKEKQDKNSAYSRAYRKRHKDDKRFKAKQLAWDRASNRQMEEGRAEIKLKASEYFAANKDVISAKHKVHKDQNREALNTKSRAYYHENSDTIMEKQRLSKIKKAKEFYALHGTWEIEPGIY